MKKVLIIGADGMLGTELLRTLKKNYLCICSTIQDLDITEYEQNIKTIKKINPQVVINAAGFTAVDLCEQEKEKAFAVNAEGTKYIALGCHESGAKCFYFSTDYVFDGKKKEPYDEDDRPNPLSVYGQSKLQGEHYIQEILNDFIIFRTSWLFSKEGSNFVKTIMKLAGERKELEMVNDQKGSPTYAHDLCRTVSALLDGDVRGVFNVSNNGACTWYEFAAKILDLIGSPLRLIPVSSLQCGRPAPRPFFSALNNKKIEKLIGFKMPHWEDALGRCIKSMGF